MADKKKWYRINPRLWNIDACVTGDVTITHEPQRFSTAVAKRVIESLGYKNGKVVMVECEAPLPPPPPPVFDDEIEEETTEQTID